MRVFWGRDLEDDNEGMDMELSKSDESICGTVGRV